MAQIDIKQIRGASQGSILFLGTNSTVSEDFPNLNWSQSDNIFYINGDLEVAGNLGVTGSTTLNGLVNVDNKYFFINTLLDLPTPVSTVITLADNTTYFFTTTVDLLGNRLVCGENTTILGGSSENCRIKSTGLVGVALITSVYSLPMRGITIEADVALNLDGDATTTAIDWFGVNFTNCPTVGIIKDYSNVIMSDCAFLNSSNCTFDGTIGSVGFGTCLFNGDAGSIFILPATLTITRRFRIIYSSIITLSGETSLEVNASAVIPNDGFILDTVNFAGGGTFLSGIDFTSPKALLINNVGILNSSNLGNLFMINNTTNTTIGVPNTNVYVKAAGTTTIGDNNSPRWTHTANRLTYAGNVNGNFVITSAAAVRASSPNQVVSIGIAKNDTIVDDSEVTIRMATSNQEYPGASQTVLQMTAGDYIEFFVRNTSSVDVRVADLNMIINKIPA